jgi:hypothetical protein
MNSLVAKHGVVKIKIRTTELEKGRFGFRWEICVTPVGYKKLWYLLVLSLFHLAELFKWSVSFQDVAVRISPELRLILATQLFGIASSK